MTDYGYKVVLEAQDCGARRFVAYHDDKFLDYTYAGEEAISRMAAQECPRCKVYHHDDEYYPVQVERGEHGADGSMYWRDAYPSRVDEHYNYELFA
jgi:hypothetical protein